MNPVEKTEKLNQIAALVRRGGANCMIWMVEEPMLAALGPTDPSQAERQIRVNNDGNFELWQLTTNGLPVLARKLLSPEEAERVVTADYVRWKERQSMTGAPR